MKTGSAILRIIDEITHIKPFLNKKTSANYPWRCVEI